MFRRVYRLSGELSSRYAVSLRIMLILYINGLANVRQYSSFRQLFGRANIAAGLYPARSKLVQESARDEEEESSSCH